MNALQSTPFVVPTPVGLNWLILADETSTKYTNFGDGREGDASSLIARVNADPALNCGHTDWRLPDIDDLESLAGTDQDPKTRAYWSSVAFEGEVDHWGYPYMMFVNFVNGNVEETHCHAPGHVRLVRGCRVINFV